MPTTEPITPRLKNDNWDLHQIAERGGTPSSMIKGTITREQYTQALAQQALVHEALDAAVDAALEQEPMLSAVIDNEQRFTPWYADDLEYFGHNADASQATRGTARYIEHIESHSDNPMHILGLHYVRLGATNGNRFVARKLREVFGIESDTDGMHAMDPFGESQRSKWQTFKDNLDALELSESQRDALFDGTRAAYVLTINLDLDDYMSADDLLAAHGKSLDKEAFDRGHSVHVNS